MRFWRRLLDRWSTGSDIEGWIERRRENSENIVEFLDSLFLNSGSILLEMIDEFSLPMS